MCINPTTLKFYCFHPDNNTATPHVSFTWRAHKESCSSHSPQWVTVLTEREMECLNRKKYLCKLHMPWEEEFPFLAESFKGKGHTFHKICCVDFFPSSTGIVPLWITIFVHSCPANWISQVWPKPVLPQRWCYRLQSIALLTTISICRWAQRALACTVSQGQGQKMTLTIVESHLLGVNIKFMQVHARGANYSVFCPEILKIQNYLT